MNKWDRMIDVNIKGVLYGIAAALPHMQRQKPGIHQRFVGGRPQGRAAARSTPPPSSPCGPFGRAASGVKPYNIRTTVISPGAVATELPNSVTDPQAAKRIRNFYARLGSIPANSFARTVAFAISQPDEVDINEIIFRPTRQEM